MGLVIGHWIKAIKEIKLNPKYIKYLNRLVIIIGIFSCTNLLLIQLKFLIQPQSDISFGQKFRVIIFPVSAIIFFSTIQLIIFIKEKYKYYIFLFLFNVIVLIFQYLMVRNNSDVEYQLVPTFLGLFPLTLIGVLYSNYIYLKLNSKSNLK